MLVGEGEGRFGKVNEVEVLVESAGEQVYDD